MPEGDFASFIEQERQRLHREREAILAEQRALEAKLAAIDREFAAVDAYESAKAGKTPGRRAAAGGTARRTRSSKREALLDLIRQHPDGLARKNILERMGLKGDKAGEMSVSNALTALTKSHQLVRAEGRYRAA